jgi:hypothetical protein
MSRPAPAPHSRFPRRLTLLTLATATALTLSACGSGAGSEDETSASPVVSRTSPAPEGVVTAAAAKRIVDTYVKTNNRANASQDAELLATVEAGQVHEQSTADYEQWDTQSEKEKRDYAAPFFYEKRSYYLPAAGTATWFAVKATSSGGSKAQTLLVFDKVEGAYKMVFAAYADEKIPEIAVDQHGLAQAADPADKVGTLAPNQLPSLYEDFFVTGGKKAGKLLASTSATKESLKVYKKARTGDEARFATKRYFTAKPAHPEVYALKLADGGVLAVFPTAHTQELVLKPQFLGSYEIHPNEKEAVYNSAKRSVVTDEFQGQGMAALTPKAPGKVIAMEYRMVNSK